MPYFPSGRPCDTHFNNYTSIFALRMVDITLRRDRLVEMSDDHSLYHGMTPETRDKFRQAVDRVTEAIASAKMEHPCVRQQRKRALQAHYQLAQHPDSDPRVRGDDDTHALE